MIKIDLISGFLGAGKTTFANKLLKYYMSQGLRPVYIVNEFGKTGLDAEVMRADGFEAIEMEGGCICCTLRQNVASTIVEIIETFAPTNIVFEPSGIFIFDNFYDIFKNPEIATTCEMGAVITVVDGVNFNFAKVRYGSFVYNQIKNAPIILLSKLDKISDAATHELVCDIKNINPNVEIINPSQGGTSTCGSFFAHLQTLQHLPATEYDNASFGLDFEQRKGKLPHAQDTTSLAAETTTPHKKLHTATLQPEPDTILSNKMLANFIAKYKAQEFGNVYRLKGVVRGESGLLLLNFAHDDITYTKFAGMAKEGITVIGEDIMIDNIKNALTHN